MATSTKKTDHESHSNGVADLRNLPVDQILHRPGFNPRGDDVGDVTDLMEMIQHGALINPITVTSHPSKADTYYLIAGARRLKAMRQLGHAFAPCSVRDIQIDSPDALALAMVENDPDGRTALSPMATAKGYQRLYDMVKGATPTDKHRAIAKILGRKSEGAYQNIRVTLRLLELDPRAASLLESGGISKWAAVTLGEIPEDVRADVFAKLAPGMSESDIRRIAQDARRERAAGVDEPVDLEAQEKHPADAAKAERPTAPPVDRSAVSEIVLWRNKSEVREKIDEIVDDLLDALEDELEPIVARCRDRIAALLWCTGVIPEVTTTDRHFKAALADLVGKAENRRGRATKKG